MNAALAAWRKLEAKPLGKALFSRFVCLKAPYFGTISPRFEELRPGYARVSMRKRRAVTNHIGTVHAIAMCNLAELAAGTMTEVSIPESMRWLPKGMTVEYLKKSTGGIHAVATLPDVADTAEGLLQAADAAMYRVKVSGKNGIHIAGSENETARLPAEEQELS